MDECIFCCIVKGTETASILYSDDVIPRFSGDGFGLKFGPKYGARPGRKELDEIAERIKAAMLVEE